MGKVFEKITNKKIIRKITKIIKNRRKKWVDI